MKKILFFASIALFMLSCSSVKVITDFDKTVDFTQYKSLEYYGWADDSDRILNRFDKERIEKAFGSEFKSRGIEPVESDGDLIVTLYIVAEQKTQKTAHTTGSGGGYGGYGGGYGGAYGYGPGYGWGGGYSTTTVSEYDYVVGTLLVSVYDAEKKELIWESRGEGTVDEDPNNAEEKIAKTVAKIMYDYPIAKPK